MDEDGSPSTKESGIFSPNENPSLRSPCSISPGEVCGGSNQRKRRTVSFISSSGTSSNVTSPFNCSANTFSPRHDHHHSEEGGTDDDEDVPSPQGNKIDLDFPNQQRNEHHFQRHNIEGKNNFNRYSPFPSEKGLPPTSSPKVRNAHSPLGEFSCDNLGDNGIKIPRFNRLGSQDSEYFNKLAAEHKKNKNTDLKFYESDADTENGSIIYRYPHGGSDRHTDSPSSMDSAGRKKLPEQTIPNSLSNTAYSPRKTENTVNNQITPNVSNLTNKRKSNDQIMPYQKRIAERKREIYTAPELEQDLNIIHDEIDTHNNQHLDQPSLNTISSPHLNPKLHNHRHKNHSTRNTVNKCNISPTGGGWSKGDLNPLYRHNSNTPHLNVDSESSLHPRAPPLPPKYSTLPRRVPEQISRTNENDGSKLETVNGFLNIVHVRKDSGDSVSTFGSCTGGASSLCRIGTQNLTERLGTEIDDFVTNKNNGDKVSGLVKRDSSSGMFSNILGSFSFSSAASVQSLEEEKAEFHEKNQAFLQKSRNSAVKPLSDPSSLQSSSPILQRTHRRPRLDSIEEGDKNQRKKKNGGRVSNILKSSNYGSTNIRKPMNLDVTRNTSKFREVGLQPDYSSDESIDDDSCISSDFTSNQDGIHGTAVFSRNYAESVGQENLSNSSSESYLSYDEDNDGLHNNEQTALLPSAGISSYEHGSGINNTQLSTLSRSRNRQQQSSRTPPGERAYHRTERNENPRRYHEERKGRKKEKLGGRFDRGRTSKHEKHRHYNKHDIDGFSRYNRRVVDSFRHSKRSIDGQRHDRRYKDGSRHYKHHRDHYDRQDRHGRFHHNRSDKDEQYRYEGHDRYDDEFSDDTYSEYEGHRDIPNRKIYNLLRRQREKLMSEWKRELKEQEEALRAERKFNSWYNRMNRWLGEKCTKVESYKANTEQFISNLPLTIGAIALAIVTLGIVWFKFAEEKIIPSCISVKFHSKDCTFPEFPGCFNCDTNEQSYKVALHIHYTCSVIAGIIAMLFFAKLFLARRVVIDEMNQPTTSSPAGLICMTMVCVFAGHGLVGRIMVTTAAFLHFSLAAWFIYMAIAYRILPDPSWYPNTVGIGITAVKTWTYYPIPGHFLMATSLSLATFFFPISLFRVAVNKKISAPVAWIQMSAPAVSLYALTIMAQPSSEQELQYNHMHRFLYMSSMHVLFFLAIVGMMSSVQGLIARWETFSEKPFSPAHAAFCFPALAHVNAIQAYRSALNSFTDKEALYTFKVVLDKYWTLTLVSSTIATLIITVKFIHKLPSWTCVDVDDEEEPPEPGETLISEFILAGDGEALRQDFVSPAVLQANETGALVRLPGREDGKTRYRRTRRVTALGFDPIMNLMELYEERFALLDWVEKNPPRTRKRTLSVPHITYNLGQFGTNNSGVFNAPAGDADYGRGRTGSRNRNYCANSIA